MAKFIEIVEVNGRVILLNTEYIVSVTTKENNAVRRITSEGETNEEPYTSTQITMSHNFDETHSIIQTMTLYNDLIVAINS